MIPQPRVVVLDTWPLVRYFKDEHPAAPLVEDLVTDPAALSILSVVNYTEVYWALTSDLGPTQANRDVATLRSLVSLDPITTEIAQAAAYVKLGWHMSLGDSFAAATALRYDAPLWTGDAELLCDDRIWQTHDLRSERLIRSHTRKISRGRLDVGRRDDHRNPFASLSDSALQQQVLSTFDRPAPSAELTL